MKANRGARSLRRDDHGAFPVVEAILVAVLVMTAIIFFTSVQRPSNAAEEGGIDLSQSAADTLALLKAKEFGIRSSPATLDTDGNGVTDDNERPHTGDDLVFDQWFTNLVAGDATTRIKVDDFLSEIIPTGADYALRLSNGVDTLTLLPDTLRPPIGARSSEVGVMPAWGTYVGASASATVSATDVDDGAAPGQPLSSSANPLLVRFTNPNAVSSPITCIRAPTGYGNGPGGATWLSIWRDADESTTATRVLTDPDLTVASSEGLAPGMWITGTGIAAGTTILTVNSAIEITLSQGATSSGAGTVSANHNRVPANIPYGTWAGYTGTITSQATCAGGTVAGYAKVWWPRYRTVTDGLIAAVVPGTSYTLTSATAQFSTLDVGLPLQITGQSGPFRITSVTSSTVAVFAGAATTGSPGSIDIPTYSPYAPYGLQLVVWFGA